MMKYLIFICSWVLCTSCVNSITLYQEHEEPRGVLQEKTVHSFLFGFVGVTNKMKIWEHCSSGGWQFINVRRTDVDVLQSILTIGLYTPSTIRFACHGSSAAPLLMEEDTDSQGDLLKLDF